MADKNLPLMRPKVDARLVPGDFDDGYESRRAVCRSLSGKDSRETGG